MVFGKNGCDFSGRLVRVPLVMLPGWYGCWRNCSGNGNALRGGGPVACAAGMPGSRRRVVTRACSCRALAAWVNNRSPLRRGDPAPSRGRSRASQPASVAAALVASCSCATSARLTVGGGTSARGRTLRPASQLGARADVIGPDACAPRSSVAQGFEPRRAAHGLRAAQTPIADSRNGEPATGRTGARLWVGIGTRAAALVALPIALARDLWIGAIIPLHYPNPRGKVWSR
jgi:hypothetical protein